MIIEPAQIRWRGDQVEATDYNDIYFRDDGLAEAERIFIRPGRIVAKAQAAQTLCIGELGFGMGTNFIAAAAAVLTHSQAHLRYVAIEKHPLSPADWQQVAQRAQQLKPLYARLTQPVLPLLAGWHERVFAEGRITLTLFHGDVVDGLAALEEQQRNPVDAWFLDGFTPSKNPDMWTPQIYAALAQLSSRDTSIASFTAAGHVRRGLAAVGFSIERLDQSPHKHHSLAGAFKPAGRQPQRAPDQVTVHGQGIGGACMARRLAEAGVTVRVCDPNPATGASARINTAVMHARLLGDGSPSAAFRHTSFHYTSAYLQGLDGFARTGVLQLQGPNMDARKLERITASYGNNDKHQRHWFARLGAAEAAALSGVAIDADALFFASAGVVDLPTLCAALLSHRNILLEANSALTPSGISDTEGIHVLCTAGGTRTFPGCDHLEISEVYGQLDRFTSPARLSNLPVVGNGYLVPDDTGVVLGASYEYRPWSQAQARNHNLQANQHLIPDADLTWQHSQRAARATSSDRMPIIGRLDGPAEIWLATAFGSMGTTAAPLAAAMVSNQLLGWSSGVSAAIEALTDPNRFARRQARRGIRHR
ncbi:MAG: tRNA (5-methylaminomethyl-2-thiouridine)(34)-methyltransferase MnmD [bacterium]